LDYHKLIEIEEKLLDDVYVYGVESAKVVIEDFQNLYARNIGSLSGFDKWSIFNVNLGGKSLLQLFIDGNKDIAEDEKHVLDGWLHSEMKVCEAIDVPIGKPSVLNDIISGQKIEVQTGEKLKKGDIFIGRIYAINGDFYASGHLSSAVDRKIAETVKGKLREAYESYCNIKGYVSFKSYAESNQWIFYKMIEIIENIDLKQDDGTVEVHSAVYIIADRKRFQEKISMADSFILDDRDKGAEYYLLLDGSDLLCEMEVHKDRIVLNGNSSDELERSRMKVEGLFEDCVAFSKSYVKNVEELLEQED